MLFFIETVLLILNPLKRILKKLLRLFVVETLAKLNHYWVKNQDRWEINLLMRLEIFSQYLRLGKIDQLGHKVKNLDMMKFLVGEDSKIDLLTIGLSVLWMKIFLGLILQELMLLKKYIKKVNLVEPIQ